MRSNVVIPDELRLHGMHIVSGKGTGKSRFMGRLLSFRDVQLGIPTVVIDPEGLTIDNLLDRINLLPPEEQLTIWPRMRYINMAGYNGRVMPFPLYYRLGDESLAIIANRYIETLGRIDPNLELAPIQGKNAIEHIGTYAGIVLAGLGYQITEAESLLTNPGEWEGRLHHLKDMYKDAIVDQTVQFWKHRYVKSEAMMFRNKMGRILLDPVSRAIYGASQQGVSWHEMVEKRLCVLVDLSAEIPDYMREMNMRWVLHSLLTFAISTGKTGRPPVSIIIDELPDIYRLHDELFAKELNRIIHQKARNNNIWLTVAHQEMTQFDEATRDVLMTMGIQILGRTDNPKTAREYAERYHPYDKDWLHDSNPIMTPLSYNGESYPIQVGEHRMFFNPDEQERLEMPKFMRRPPLHFYIELANSKRLRPAWLPGEDVRRDLNIAFIKRAKDLLIRKFGISITQVEQEIRARLNENVLPVYAGTLEYEVPAGYAIQRQGGDDEDPVFKAARTGTGKK